MKKNIQTLIIILIIPLVGFSQNKFSFGVNTNVEIGFTSIEKSDLFSQFDESLSNIITYSAGLQAQYNFNNNTFVRSGVNFINKDISYTVDGFLFGTGITDTTTNSSRIDNDINIKSIAIPVDYGIMLNPNNEKVNFIVGIGVLYQI